MSDGVTGPALTRPRVIRSELADLRTVVLVNIERTRPLEAVKDDLQLMIKARLNEMAGRFGAAFPSSPHFD